MHLAMESGNGVSISWSGLLFVSALLLVGVFETVIHLRAALSFREAPQQASVQREDARLQPVTSSQYLEAHKAVVPPPKPVHGADLSRWQGVVDFPALSQRGLRFVFIKATEGESLQDPNYRRNVLEARRANLQVGSYHFFDANATPDAQLRNFSSYADVQPGDLPPAIDIETLASAAKTAPSVQLVDEVKKFAEGIFAKYGVKPLIYSNRSFANQYNLGTALAEYPLWISEWNVTEPGLPSGWSNWVFWQYTSGGTNPGIRGFVDLDAFHGNANEFDAIRIPSPTQKVN